MCHLKVRCPLALLLHICIASNFSFCESFHLGSSTRSLARVFFSHVTGSIDHSTEEGDVQKSVRIFLDIAVEEEPIGRLIFQIPNSDILPVHTENLVKLCSQERRSIDPRCSYVGCNFNFSPQFIEGFPQYRWAHLLQGKGRNAIGRPEEKISDPDRLRECAHAIYGGVYYGLLYDDIPGSDEEAVVLTVPLAGPGRGSTGLSIVRVGESPQEWRERLLSNSAVLGWMEPSSRQTLEIMARQTVGPPLVVDSGVIEDERD